MYIYIYIHTHTHTHTHTHMHRVSKCECGLPNFARVSGLRPLYNKCMYTHTSYMYRVMATAPHHGALLAQLCQGEWSTPLYYIYIYIYIYIYVCVCVCVHTHTCTRTLTHTHV